MDLFGSCHAKRMSGTFIIGAEHIQQRQGELNAMSLLHDRRFRIAALSMTALIIAIIAAEILMANTPPPLVSDISAVVCVAIAAYLYAWAWRRMSRQEVSRKVWGLVTLGVLFWALAELTWAFYELVLKIEIPYPSVADLFWLAGYVPVYAALLIRYRSFKSSASARQKWLIALFIVLYTALLSFYVVLPILAAFDTSRLAEGLTNIAYPLVDWGLCILTLVIIFSLESGRFSAVWRLFGGGTLLMATADLIYFYATWNEI